MSEVVFTLGLRKRAPAIHIPIPVSVPNTIRKVGEISSFSNEYLIAKIMPNNKINPPNQENNCTKEI